MHESEAKEPGAILTLNGYAFFQSQPQVQQSQQQQQRVVADALNSGNLNVNLPNPTIIALHQETHEEFTVSKIPKAQLNTQKCATIANELKIGQQLRTLSHVRILCDVIDYQDHLFLFYSAPPPLQQDDSKQKLKHQRVLNHGGIGNCGVEMTLLDYLKEVKVVEEQEAKVIFGQLINILIGCHERKIAHRDLKLPSVLINPVTKNIRIADFSQAAIVEVNTLFSDRKGSPAYVAPEIIVGKPYPTFSPDYWAAGVILYALLTGTFPFMDSTPRQLFEKILQNNPTPLPSHLSLSSCQLIKALLKPDHNTRLAGNHVLNHDWLKSTTTTLPNSDGGSDMEEDDQVVPDFD